MREQMREWIDALQGGDPDARAVAATALAELGSAAVGLLWPLLNDLRPPVRAAAASVLGKIGPAAEPAVPALARLLRDRDAEVRRHATTALRSIDPGYLSRRTRWRWFRRLVAAAGLLLLVLAGNAWDIPGRALGLVRGEKFFEGWPTHSWAEQLDSFDQGRRDLAMARLRAGGQRSFPILADIATDKRHNLRTRLCTIELLGRRELGEAVPVLTPLLEDEEQSLRRAAAEALGHIGSGAQAAVPALYTGLNKPSDPARESYASALDKIGGKAPAQNICIRFRDRGAFSEKHPWFSLFFSADGKQLMAHRDDHLQVWGRSLSVGGYCYFSLRDGVRRAAIHPNGKEAVVADVTGGLAHYRIGRFLYGGGEKLAELGRLPQKDVPVVPDRIWRRLAYSPDGRILAVIRGGALEVYDVTDVTRVPWKRRTLQGLPTTPVHSVMFSADSQTIAVLDGTKLEGAPRLSGGAWWLFDMKTGRLRQRLPAGHITGNQTALSPNGRFLAVNSDLVKRKVHVWNTEDGKEAAVLGDDKGAGIMSLAFVGPNQLAIGAADGTLALWDARTGKKLRDLHWHNCAVQALAVSPDGKTLASADEHGWVKLWDLREGVDSG